MTRKPLLAFFGGVLATVAVVVTLLLLTDGPNTGGFGQNAYAQQAQKPSSEADIRAALFGGVETQAKEP